MQCRCNENGCWIDVGTGRLLDIRPTHWRLLPMLGNTARVAVFKRGFVRCCCKKKPQAVCAFQIAVARNRVQRSNEVPHKGITYGMIPFLYALRGLRVDDSYCRADFSALLLTNRNEFMMDALQGPPQFHSSR
jgi:hypothetical protein